MSVLRVSRVLLAEYYFLLSDDCGVLFYFIFACYCVTIFDKLIAVGYNYAWGFIMRTTINEHR